MITEAFFWVLIEADGLSRIILAQQQDGDRQDLLVLSRCTDRKGVDDLVGGWIP